MSFEKLLKDIQTLDAEQETMTKALPAGDGKDDTNIQAAAEEGGDMEGKEDGDEDGEGSDGANGDEQPLGKSLGTVTLENGEKVDAVDGTEMMKSLMADMALLKTANVTRDEQVMKALEGAVGLVKSQATMLKSLQAQVAKLGGEGRGRKTVVSIAEKRAVTGSNEGGGQEQGMTADTFMAKSHEAWSAGRITGKDLTVIDVSLRQNIAIDQGLLSKVMMASA